MGRGMFMWVSHAPHPKGQSVGGPQFGEFPVYLCLHPLIKTTKLAYQGVGSGWTSRCGYINDTRGCGWMEKGGVKGVGRW